MEISKIETTGSPSGTAFGQQKGPSYLPKPRGLLKEKLVCLRFYATYWTWKRIICKHIGGNMQKHVLLRFLDVGCGPGNFICCLEKWFPDAEISGVDVDMELLTYAAGRANRTNLLQGSAEELPFADESFDVVSALQVVEHLCEPERFFEQGHRVLRDGGLLLLATPNPNGFAARLLGKRWRGIRYDHISLRLPDRWRRTLQTTGFDVVAEGTTLFNGVPVVGSFPLDVPFGVLQAVFGWFPWQQGSSYMSVAKKTTKVENNLEKTKG